MLLQTFLRFGVSTDSNSLPYWVAQLLDKNQSDGREEYEKTIPFRARETLIQFWSPLQATAEAKHSCSWVFHSSRGLRMAFESIQVCFLALIWKDVEEKQLTPALFAKIL